MTNSFEPVIQYYLAKKKIHERTAYDIRLFIKYLVEQEEHTKQRMREVIEKINFETLQPSSDYGDYPVLGFGHEPCDFGTYVMFDYDGSIELIDDQELLLRTQSEDFDSEKDRLKYNKERLAVKIQTDKIPVSFLGIIPYPEDYYYSFYYAWIAYIWQQVEGYKCGLQAWTSENSSISRYSLNDFLRDSLSKYCDHKTEYETIKIYPDDYETGDYDEDDYMEDEVIKKPERLSRLFPRDFTLVELFLRADQPYNHYSNPYENYWRYYEKGDQFKEIVMYNYATAIRTGNLSERHTAKLQQTYCHKNAKAAIEYLTKFTNRTIHDGWEERLRPLDMPEQMHESAYDFGKIGGFRWSTKEVPPQVVTDEKIMELAKALQISLPSTYIAYLKILNDWKGVTMGISYPVDDYNTVKMDHFFTLSELSAENKKQPIFLKIGKLMDDTGELYLNVETDTEQYGRVATKLNGEDLKLHPYHFKKFAKYAQTDPVSPEIFAAQENDVEFIKKRLSEGWDPTTKYTYQTSFKEAISHNAYDVIELLLQERPDFRKQCYPSYKSDDKTKQILAQYRED